MHLSIQKCAAVIKLNYNLDQKMFSQILDFEIKQAGLSKNLAFKIKIRTDI